MFSISLNIGHVTNTQMRRVLSQNGILISDFEFNALVKRYTDDNGFNYTWFLREADPQEYLIYAPKVCLSAYSFLLNKLLSLQFEENRVPPAPANRITATNDENKRKHNRVNMVRVFAKIKGYAVRNRVRMIDFFKDYDKHNELCILETDLRRGLNLAGIKLELMELNLICEVLVDIHRYKIFV